MRGTVSDSIRQGGKGSRNSGRGGYGFIDPGSDASNASEKDDGKLQHFEG